MTSLTPGAFETPAARERLPFSFIGSGIGWYNEGGVHPGFYLI
jgi:hypothetical protein